MNELLELGRMGIIGIFLALIGLVVFTVKLLYSFAANHVHHTNEAIKESTKVSQELVGAVRENTDVTKEMKDILIRQRM